MSDDLSKVLELQRDAPRRNIESRRCSRWATASVIAGVAALLVGVLAYALAGSHSRSARDVGEVCTLLGLPVGLVAVLLSLIAVLRIAFSRQRRSGYGRALLALGLGLITTAGLLYMLAAMIEHARTE